MLYGGVCALRGMGELKVSNFKQYNHWPRVSCWRGSTVIYHNEL